MTAINGSSISNTIVPEVVVGLTSTMSTKTARTSPIAPIISGRASDEGDTPRAVVKTNASMTKMIAIPVPIGAAAATLSACFCSSATSESFSLACWPPAASIAACSVTAVSHAVCPCRSIIAALHSSPTFVRRLAPAPISLKLETTMD